MLIAQDAQYYLRVNRISPHRLLEFEKNNRPKNKHFWQSWNPLKGNGDKAFRFVLFLSFLTFLEKCRNSKNTDVTLDCKAPAQSTK